VVSAFENGVLERFSATLRSCRSPARKEQFLAEVVATASVEERVER
jgi:DNA topoisomerase I